MASTLLFPPPPPLLLNDPACFFEVAERSPQKRRKISGEIFSIVRLVPSSSSLINNGVSSRFISNTFLPVLLLFIHYTFDYCDETRFVTSNEKRATNVARTTRTTTHFFPPSVILAKPFENRAQKCRTFGVLTTMIECERHPTLSFPSVVVGALTTARARYYFARPY